MVIVVLKRTLIIILAIGLTNIAHAQDVKNHSIGLTRSTTSVNHETAGAEDSSGLGLSYTLVFSDSGHRQWASRFTYASHESCCYRGVSVTALDASVLWGRNLNRQGFKWAAGGGYFYENFSYPNRQPSDVFSGLQLTGALGYNFQPFSLDFWLNFRSGDSYDTGFYYGAESALNVGISAGFRF